jgi:predicted SAM-dependent methyltransferase
MIKEITKIIFRKFGLEVHRSSNQTTPLPVSVSKDDEVDDFTRLMNEFHKFAVIKLHFGSGPRILKGWINIDLSYEPYENYVKSYGDKYYPVEIRGNKSDLYAFDITKRGLPIPDNSVDIIFHEDFLEHLSQRNQILFLAETLRTLKKGGAHRVNTPDLISSMRDHSHFTIGLLGVYLDEWDRWHHINVLTPALLREMALMVGYSSVIFNTRDQSIVKEYLPLEYRPAIDRPDDGNIFADLIK